MSNALTYIQTNNLPCTTWIDATDPSRISINGSTFVALNKIGNTAYDFIQTNATLHPIITASGLTFTDNRRLFPRQTDIFSPILQQSTYSMIFVTKGNTSPNQQLLSIAKNNPLLPAFLEVKQGSGKSKHSFSNVNLESFLTFDSYTGSVHTLMFSHDIRLGKTRTSVNKGAFSTKVNTNKGYILNNFPSTFYLGNSQAGLPFRGELLHFLIFIPSITDAHLLNLANLLVDGKPLLNNSSEDFNRYAQAHIGFTPGIVLTPNILHTPLFINNAHKTALVNANAVITLSLYLNWRTLEVIDWDNITEEFWNTME